jgi:glycosyltransferase involved in cell wall biosynthesis
MRVRIAPYQPHSLAFGGFEIQMRSALAAALAQGVDAEPLDPWKYDDSFDVLHVWGLGLVHEPAIYWARNTGKRVVMTALLPYLTARSKVRHLLLRGERSRSLVKLLRFVDRLAVVNDLQAESAVHLFGVAEEKIEIIPNIVEEQYFQRSAGEIPHNFGITNYVLTTGNVCERKNQLALAQACKQYNIPLLMIGDVLSGEEAYGKKLAELVADVPTILWLRKMAPGSSELVWAYRNCVAFALPSFNETQPISLLEASAMGKPILVSNLPFARQAFYKNALRISPGSSTHIAKGILELLANPQLYITPYETMELCRAHHIGKAYKSVYQDKSYS